MIYQSWCGYCSRGWADKRILEVNEKYIICTTCKRKSEMITDPDDSGYFFLKRLEDDRKR